RTSSFVARKPGFVMVVRQADALSNPCSLGRRHYWASYVVIASTLDAPSRFDDSNVQGLNRQVFQVDPVRLSRCRSPFSFTQTFTQESVARMRASRRVFSRSSLMKRFYGCTA